jgi:RNA polymerase sigma-70 factor (ECF subfamily)
MRFPFFGGAGKKGASRPNDPRVAPVPDVDEETDYDLLQRVQGQLRAGFQRVAPQSVANDDFDRFFKFYSAIIRRMARQRGVPADAVDDVVQEIWVQVLRQLPEFVPRRRHGSFRAWLYTLTTGKAADVIRCRTRQPCLPLNAIVGSESEPMAGAVDPAGSTAELARESLLESVWEVLSLTIPDSFAVFHLRVRESKSVAEVALQLKLTPEQVYRHCQAARSEFARLVRSFTARDFDGRLPG